VGRRTKTLNELILDRTFEARRANHRELLFEEDVRDKSLREIQARFRDCGNEFEQRSIAKELEEAIADGAGGPGTVEELQTELKKLGREHSAKRTINFFPRFFAFDDGSPFTLEDWQQEGIREGDRRDKHGRRIYKQIDEWIPRGNGKTPKATGRSIVAALGPNRPRVFQISGDLQQAKLGLEYAQNWINDGELARFFETYSRVIRRRDGRGKIEILPAGGTGAHGRRPRVAVVDELWAFETQAQVKTYTALETKIFADLEAYLHNLSTAGYDKTTIGGQNWDSGFKLPVVRTYREGFLTIAKDEEAGRLFIAYGMPEGYELDLEDDAAVLKAIRLANPGSWIDPRELLRALRRTNDVNEWLRFNLNFWTKARGTWFKTGLWKSLYSKFSFKKGDVVFVGVDCALVHDTAVIAWAKRLDNGRIAVKVEVFSPVEGVPAHRFFRDGVVDTDELEAFVLELARERGYKIAEIAYDPTFFHDTAKRLKNKGFRMIEYTPSSAPYGQAINDFYKLCNDGVVTHDGDEIFAAHAEAVAAEKRENIWRLYRLKASHRFDAVVAAALAVERCAFDKRSVYEKRGLIVLEHELEQRTPSDGPAVERVSLARAAALGLLDQADDTSDDFEDDEEDEWED
jgi:phage terminase large subunit-like protein